MHVRLELAGEEHDLWLVREGETVKVEVDGETLSVRLGEPGSVTIGERTYRVEINDTTVIVDGLMVPFRIADFKAGGAPGDHAAGGARGARIKPPMPGKIVSVAVKDGDDVQAGQILLVLEAMKMQNEIPAPSAGKIKKVHVQAGQNVEGKDVLIEIE